MHSQMPRRKLLAISLLSGLACCHRLATLPELPGDLQADYVIVGAGSAGSVLASRLSATGASVLVLEAGSPDSDARLRDPAKWTGLLTDSTVAWQFKSEPQAALAGRAINQPRGKVWGGSSSINAMMWLRGQREDFDDWARLGAKGWSWKDVEPYFSRTEEIVRPVSRATNEMDDAFLAAASEAGLPSTGLVDGSAIGSGHYQFNERDGERFSTATAYLRPALTRPNLQVESSALVSRIVFEGKRAVGVDFLQAGTARRALARKEVILSAGTIGSPAILLRSGVGPAADLRALGIEVVTDLPVGRNLHDHIQAGVSWRSQRALTTDGRCNDACIGVGGFVARAGAARADFQVILVWNPGQGTYRQAVVLSRPFSRGHLRLRSSDPSESPILDPGYLSDPRDVALLVEGLRLARRIGAAQALGPFRGEELAPGAGVQGEAALRQYIAGTASTMWHPVGTCRMGEDDDAVVNSELRVRGLERLRVVDASVMPTITSANTNAPTIMIAEKASDLILAAQQ
jgi:choline dehydrogenase